MTPPSGSSGPACEDCNGSSTPLNASEEAAMPLSDDAYVESKRVHGERDFTPEERAAILAARPVPGVPGSTLRGAAYANSVHTLFSEMTHGAYGRGWTDACLFIAEQLRQQEAKHVGGGADLERVGEAIANLYATYAPEGVGVWLRAPMKTLDGRYDKSPVGLIIEGRADEFCAAVDRLDEGMGT